MKDLLTYDFGDPLHCLVIPSKTHEIEDEMLELYDIKNFVNNKENESKQNDELNKQLLHRPSLQLKFEYANQTQQELQQKYVKHENNDINDMKQNELNESNESNSVKNTENSLYCGGLPLSLNEDQIKTLLSTYGPLSSFSLIRDDSTGFSKGYCYFNYQNSKVVDAAVRGLNGIVIGDNVLVVRTNESVST